MAEFPTFKGSWPWPWIWSYCIPTCITHGALPTYQISLKSKKLFVDGRTDGHMRPTLLGRLRVVDIKTATFGGVCVRCNAISCRYAVTIARRFNRFTFFCTHCIKLVIILSCARSRKRQYGSASCHTQWSMINNSHNEIYLVKVLRPTCHKIGHLGDVLPSQSLGKVLKKLNPTQQSKQNDLSKHKNTQNLNRHT